MIVTTITCDRCKITNTEINHATNSALELRFYAMMRTALTTDGLNTSDVELVGHLCEDCLPEVSAEPTSIVRNLAALQKVANQLCSEWDLHGFEGAAARDATITSLRALLASQGVK